MIRSFSCRLMKRSAWLGVLLFSACATYHPMPLPPLLI